MLSANQEKTFFTFFKLLTCYIKITKLAKRLCPKIYQTTLEGIGLAKFKQGQNLS